MMTISEKVKLLDMLKEGRSFAAVARHYGVNESTVRCIKKDEANIRKTALKEGRSFAAVARHYGLITTPTLLLQIIVSITVNDVQYRIVFRINKTENISNFPCFYPSVFRKVSVHEY